MNRALSETEESLYKEVTFENSNKELIKTVVNVDNKTKVPKASQVRNWDRESSEKIKKAILPRHSQLKLFQTNRFETYIDPYKYLEDPTSKQKLAFNIQENAYREALSVKHYFLETAFGREIENRNFNPELIPIHSAKNMYYRNIDNIADNLTIYRYPLKHIKEEDRGKIPTKNLELYEERIFIVNDLTKLYDEYALKINAIKECIESINELIAFPTHNLIYWFETNISEDKAAIIFDINNDGKFYDILIKDLQTKCLLPIIVRNSNGDVAFDQLNGFYYVLRDLNGRGTFSLI